MIIIETPAPPTRERLVLVPPESVSIVRENGTVIGLSIRANDARDATPADLARGGWGPLSAFVGPLGLLSPPTLAGALEAVEGIRQDADRWEHLESEQRSRVTSYLEERDEAVERAEKAEGLLIQRETELRLAREDGAAVERQMREARSAADASFVRANRAEMRAEKAERELAAERDSLRAELARLAAPGEGEPTDEELRAVHGRACGGATADGDTRALCIARRALWRAGVAYERARQQDRATDEELFAAYQRAFVLAADEEDDIEGEPDPERLKADRVTPEERAGILAVAARVRQERCLVAQAVGMGADLHVVAHGGADERQVTVAKGRHMQRAYPDAVDVPSTLARLLGEVARG